MGGISQWSSELRGLPDQALQQELQHPSGIVPSYMVLAEAQRRQSMRQAAQQQQAQGQSSTVLQDVVRNMMASQPPPGIAPAGMTPPRNGQTPTPPQPPVGMARGGRYAEGDLVDEEDDEGNAPVPGALTSRLLPQTQPEAQALVNKYVPRNLRPSPADVDGWIEKYSKDSGVDSDMARAIMHQESGGRVNVRSPAGAFGLFQLMPGTAQEMGVDPRIPEQNVKGGIQYYAKMLKQFGDPQIALAAYNAGPTAVAHHGNAVPPFPETQKYVAAITNHYNQLKGGQQSAAPQAAASAAPQAAADAAAATTPPPNAPPPAAAAPAAAPSAPAPSAPAPSDEGSDEGQPVYQAIVHPGRIHQNISDLQTQQAELEKQLAGMKDPYSPDNMQAMRQNILTAYGLPPNYLESLGGDARKATIRQLQEEAAARYHNPNPWEFLSNIAAGMGASKSLNLAGAFGEGVGHAWQRRDEQQQEAFNEWNGLQKDADQIDANAETARGRFDTLLNSVLTHQATVKEAQRKLLTDQLTRNTEDQQKLQRMLVPTNKFEAYLNPEDHTPEEIATARTAWGQAHNMSASRLTAETNAIQKLSELNDPFVPNGPFATAYDQIVQKHPNEAGKLLAKPSKFSDADIASYANSVNAEPAGLYDPKVVPKDAATAVRAYMTEHGMRVPVQPPNKALQDSAALGYRTLTHLDRLNNFAQDPWLTEHVFGPWAGRMAKGEEKVGMEQLDLTGAKPQQTRDAQDMLTSLNYLRMIEGKGLLGGRPAVQLMQQLMQTTPDVHMAMPRFLGAMDATRASANMAIQSHHDWMYGVRSTGAIPAGARVAADPAGRRVMQAAPGQPWMYMDTPGVEYKPAAKQP